MRILLSNDDGYFAPGIDCLAQRLSKFAEITVVAPERDYSGASNSLTLDRPLSLKRAPNGYYYVNGTPTDCVHLAVTGMLDELPDMVVSGVNHGANLGDDTIYSGTLAAATEGYLLGVPSLAISLCSKHGVHFDTAARVAQEIVEKIMARECRDALLFNVNVPDVPYDELNGKTVTRLGRRHRAEGVIRTLTPRNDTVFWVGAAGAAKDATAGTDFHAVQNKQVSITPLSVDLTHNQQIPEISEWFNI